jgi:hypothetical protein
MAVHRKAKKSAPETTAPQQSVIKARLKFLMQNFFSAKSIYKCVIDDESYFMVDGNESTKRPTDTANRRFLGELEKENLQQQLLSKRCKLLDGKDQKRSEVH